MAKKSTTTKKLKADSKSKKPEVRKMLPDIPPHYAIQAYAGTGKTTTLEWTEYGYPADITPSAEQEAIFEALDPPDRAEGPIRFACFNTSIEAEAIPRFEDADVRTNHKLGFHSLKETLNLRVGRNFVNGRKYQRIAFDIVGNPYDDNKLWPIVTTVTKLTDLARCTLTGNALQRDAGTENAGAIWEVNQSELIEMAEFYNIEIEDPDALKYVEEVINEGIKSCRKWMDYTDMVFLPNALSIRPKKVQRCYVDEFQDLNAAQQGIHYDPVTGYSTAEQFVIVGDPHQSMYGFAGADPDAMHRFEQRVGASILPLSITRRCPHSHVERALRHLPEGCKFQAAKENPDGTIVGTDFTAEFYRAHSEMTVIDKDDPDWDINLFLSRTNAPLVRHCFMCWKNKIPAVIRGRDVGAGLVNVIKRFEKDAEKKAVSQTNNDIMVALHGLVATDFGSKIDKYEKLEKEDLAEAKRNELSILTQFIEESDSVKDCTDKMWAMFNDNENKARAIQFSTVHKAKGLEAHRVGNITPELMPHPGLSKMGAFWAEQERNIAYVCDTRSMDTILLNEAEFDQL